jgi:DNA-binding PadR family transcriptional regulator
MNPQDQLPLAPRDLLILAVLAEGPLHGYGLIKAVEARSEAGVLLDPANLYRVLRRMKRLGWIREATDGDRAPPVLDSGPDTAGPQRGSRPDPGEDSQSDARPDSRRRIYQITPAGSALLEAELRRLDRLLRQVRPVLADGEGR